MERRKIYRVLTEGIKSQLTNKPYEGEDIGRLNSEELACLFNLAKFHDVASVIFDFLFSNKLIDKQEPTAKKFLAESFSVLNRYERLRYELETIKKILEEEKINFIPLKGSVIRAYYKKPELRTSCDIDIYVDKKDQDRAIEIFKEKLNYRFEHQYKEETTFFAESGVCVELHCDLSDGEREVEELFSKVFDNAVKEDGYDYCYLMSKEDFALHSLTHLAKHFKSGGCGVRTIMDTFIINTEVKPDQEKIREVLEKVNLYKFYLAIVSLTEAWFLGKEFSDVDYALEEYVLEGGVYGTLNNKVVAQQVLKGKRGYLFKRIFPSYSMLKSPYPVLIKCPILYPFCLVHRWFKALFGSRRKRAQAEMKINKGVTEEKKTNTEKLFNQLGL